MAVDGSLIFDTKINTEGFQKGRKSITNSLDGMKSAVLKFGATLGAIFGVKQIIEFGKKRLNQPPKSTLLILSLNKHLAL